MDFSNVKKLTIEAGDVKKIEINGVVVWEEPTSLKNWVLYSTENDGVTIYNGGLGYKKDYRIRSGGAEASAPNVIITGFIPFKKGDVLRIYPPFTGKNTNNTINFFDSGFTNLGQQTDSGGFYGICAGNYLYKSTVINGVSTLTYNDSFDSRIAYVRIGHSLETMEYDQTKFIVTINEEIPV